MINKFSVCLLFCFCLSEIGCTRTGVWVEQWPESQQYTVGQTAVIHCRLLKDQSHVKAYDMMWVIFDHGNGGKVVDLLDVPAYANASKESNVTYSKLTLKHLTMNHMDKLVCKALCLVNRTLTQLFGTGTILRISNASQSEESITSHQTPLPPLSDSFSWIHYLIISANVLFLLVGSIICIGLMHKRKCSK